MSKFFDTWKKIYGSKIAKASRDFLLGKDMDLSDEAYREKYGYNKPNNSVGIMGMLVAPEWTGVENLTKGISGFGGAKYNAGLEALEAERQAQKALKVYDTMTKRDAFLKERFGKVWKDFTPEEQYGLNVRFRDKWLKDGGVIKAQNGIPKSAKVGSYFRGLKDYLFGTTNSFKKSDYIPTKGNDIKDVYYTRDGLKEEVILNLFGGIDSNAKNSLGDKNYFYRDFNDAYNQLTSSSNVNASRNASNGTLGTYAVSAGSDDRGRYISFNDTFDHVIIPGKGIPIYDRIYEDEWKNLYNSNRSALNEGDFFTKSPVLKKLNKNPQQ